MDDFEKFENAMAAFQKQAIADASKLDPAFAASVAENRQEIEEHEKMLDAQQAKKKQEQPDAVELLNLQSRMIETSRTPK